MEIIKCWLLLSVYPVQSLASELHMYLLYFLIMQQKYYFAPFHPICVICVELQHVLCENTMTYQKHIYLQIIGAMPADTDSCLRDVFIALLKFPV